MRTKIPYDSRLQSKAEIFLNQDWDKKSKPQKPKSNFRPKPKQN